MSKDKNRLNILFLPKWYPNKNSVYNGVFVHRHAIAVNKQNNVFVVYAKANDEPQSKLIELEQSIENGIDIHRYYYKKKITGVGVIDSVIKFWLYFSCMRMGYNTLSKQGVLFDLVHVHILGRTGLFAIYLKLFKNLKFIITEHWSGYLSKVNIGWSRRSALDKSAAITVVSDYLKQGLMSNYTINKKIEIIPNVVSDLFLKEVIFKNIDSEKKVILHISDLDDEVKNISGLISAVEELQKVRQDFVLKIVGAGKDKEKLKTLVAKSNSQNFILFEGEKNEKELVNYFNESAFLISNSNYETFGISLIESFAMGTPVVAANLPTFQQFIAISEGGVLVEKGNIDDLVEKMDFMLNHFEDYNNKDLRKYVEENYSMEVVGAQFDRLYHNALENA